MSSERASERQGVKGARSKWKNAEAYIRDMNTYLRNGDWVSMFYGEYEQHKVKYRVRAMAYDKDGNPKRDVGKWYPDIGTYTQEMFDEDKELKNGRTRKTNSSDNKSPWKKISKVKIPDEDAQRLREDIEFAEELTESLMVQMIHTINENGFDVNGNDFLSDMGFVIEVVRSLIYREMGLQHPLKDIMSELVISEIDATNRVSTSLDIPKTVETTKFLSEEFNDEDPEVS